MYIKNKLLNYNIISGSDTMNNLHNMVKNYIDCSKILIIMDDNVEKLYSKNVIKQFFSSTIKIHLHVIKSGDNNKNLYELMNIIEKLSLNQFTRSDAIIAMGGGMISDIASLGASLFMRGIKLIIIPTTILCAIDACIGGKTAINLKYGKNLLGSFYMADLIILDYSLFKSLPDIEISNGISEIIKYSLLNGEYVIELLEKAIFIKSDKYYLNMKNLELLINECMKIKMSIVNEDNFDNGKRLLLNLGHTVAHALESRANYQISHGVAVSIGISVIIKLCLKENICDKSLADEIYNILKKYHLQVISPYNIDELMPYILNDKKGRNNNINLILVENFGKCFIKSIKKEELYDFLKKGF